MEVVPHTDVGAFARLARPLLEPDPVRHTSILTVLHGVRTGAFDPVTMLTVREDHTVVGALLRTAGQPALVSAVPPRCAGAVVEALVALDPEVDGVQGPPRRRGARRGNCRSPRPPGWTSTVDEQADDAAALLRGLEMSPTIVFGTSAGASIAANLAIRHPEVLRAVAFPEPVTAGSLGGVLRVVRHPVDLPNGYQATARGQAWHDRRRVLGWLPPR